MIRHKKYLAVLTVLLLLLCAVVVISKAVNERETAHEDVFLVDTAPVGENEKAYEQPVLTTSPDSTPEPTPDITPEPTVEPTPDPTPVPTPEPTPNPAPVITKNPTNETSKPGGTVYFIAKADNASAMSWFIASPDGKEGVNAEDISSKFPDVSCTGTRGEMLGIANIDSAMDGWKVICKFSGPGGDSFSEPAYIYVLGATEYLRSIDEVLVLVLNARDPEWTMALGLSYTKTTGRIADFFYETDISADEVRSATLKFTQQLSEEHRAAYKARMDLVIQYYTGISSNPDGYTGLLSDSGYQARHWPWDDERVAACFEALCID